jgi:hypothetical protein
MGCQAQGDGMSVSRVMGCRPGRRMRRACKGTHVTYMQTDREGVVGDHLVHQLDALAEALRIEPQLRADQEELATSSDAS